jgi:hypothetical protein
VVFDSVGCSRAPPGRGATRRAGWPGPGRVVSSRVRNMHILPVYEYLRHRYAQIPHADGRRLPGVRRSGTVPPRRGPSPLTGGPGGYPAATESSRLRRMPCLCQRRSEPGCGAMPVGPARGPGHLEPAQQSQSAFAPSSHVNGHSVMPFTATLGEGKDTSLRKGVQRARAARLVLILVI